MPRWFSRQKKEVSLQSQFPSTRVAQEKQVEETVEAGLYPVRVATRQGARIAQFSFKVALVVVVLIGIASYFGFFEPIRQYLRPIQSGNGSLVVSTDFVRAQVSLDGKVLGQTPFTGENISSGRHTLKVQAAENPNNYFKESEIEIVINPGNATVVKANPAPSQGLFSYTIISSENREEGDSLLVVKALPKDVKVSVDGNAVGVAPYVTESISEGSHQLMLDKKGFRPVLLDISIANNKVVTVETKLYQYQITLER